MCRCQTARHATVPFAAGRRRRKIAAALVLAAAIVPAGRSSAAPPAPAAAVTGVTVSPDGTGVRVLIAISGPFHYLIDGRAGDRIMIVVDPVSAAAAIHTLATGPVRGIRVRSLSGTPPRAAITVLTTAPLRAAQSSIEDGALAVTLMPARGPAAAISAGAAAGPPAQAPPDRIAPAAPVNRAVTLDEGTGQLLAIDHLARVAVSDPRIADAVPVTGRQLLVTARAAGRTTIYVWETRGRVVTLAVEVRPAEDTFRDLRRALAALLPSSSITVTAVRDAHAGMPATPAVPAAGPAIVPRLVPFDSVGAGAGAPGAYSRGAVLSGTVETQLDRSKAEDVARAFVPVVVNLLDVRRPVQFSLHVEVVELSHSAQDSLGISWGGGQQMPGSEPTLNGGVYNLQVLTAPSLSASGLDVLIAQLAALSQRGEARLLARPGLVVLAGQTASLLLGGQVPVPVAGQNGTVTIEYKDFGVILKVRPDYQDDGRIFLQIAPEVSTLDFTDAIKVGGFTIPALEVRRTQTVVAMRPGETLVLGGLLQHNDVELVQKIPLLGDLPVIGALFKSRSFQHQDSDLVILVTPQVVDAAPAP
jgi:pilus assembly protein CpaC